ncbi:hypothetical protein ACFFKC_10465 [Pseudoduganella danionis]|uniref:Lipoprotein n=1 Tax=Pseudoduganella danionis TaxID=1890295 RepID=A0ABW9SLR0_9BURK|nr:hypothetical protein [Pseudoduganella danionis]MTW32554.1 hypothetical protein [Pseudoduganella danionis]
MKLLHLTLATASALLLSACGSQPDTAQVQIKVSDLSAGVYAVSSGDAANPVEGKYYAAADGSRLLVLNDGGQKAASLYQRAGNGAWRMTPAPASDTSLELASSNAISASVASISTLARSYTLRLANGEAASFSINSNGDIVAGSSSCKLTGKLSSSTLPNTLKASLSSNACGDLPAQSDGYLVLDGDYAPASFRLLTSAGNSLLDLWAYAE